MLTKTQFIHGCQCHLRLWLEARRPDLAELPDPVASAQLAQGRAVGELARRRYPGARLVAAGPGRIPEALAETGALVQDPDVPGLFEGAFEHQGTRVRADVLTRVPGGWRLTEVKAASACKAGHDLDLALQAWVLRGAGLPVREAGVLTLDPDYVYDGVSLDPDRLFRDHDRSEAVEALAPGIEGLVAAQQAILAAQAPPAVSPGPHCLEPGLCPFHAHCARGRREPEHPLSDLPRFPRWKQAQLEAAGITSLEQLPEGLPLTRFQARVRDCAVAGRPWVSPRLRAALEAFRAPIRYLDFETYSPAIPRYRGMRPFQRVPFQWSCHHEDREGGLHHAEFLPEDGDDPRERFARALLADLGTEGSICVYSEFEASVVRELAAQLPGLARALLALTPRFVDLLHLLRSHYYHPAFHGSYAIKRVLPVLVPGLDYQGLAIRRGDAASQAFLDLIGSRDPARRAALHRDLLAYCGLDTLAMVKVRRALAAIAEQDGPEDAARAS